MFDVGFGAGIYKDSYNFYGLLDVDPEIFETIKVGVDEEIRGGNFFTKDIPNNVLAITRNRYAGLVNAGFLSDESEWSPGL